MATSIDAWYSFRVTARVISSAFTSSRLGSKSMKNTSFVTCYLLFIEEATSYFGANNCMSSLLPFSLEIRSEVLPAKLFAFHYIYILFKKKK